MNRFNFLIMDVVVMRDFMEIVIKIKHIVEKKMIALVT